MGKFDKRNGYGRQGRRASLTGFAAFPAARQLEINEELCFLVAERHSRGKLPLARMSLVVCVELPRPETVVAFCSADR